MSPAAAPVIDPGTIEDALARLAGRLHRINEDLFVVQGELALLRSLLRPEEESRG